ncbi:Uncharacterized protein Adt_14514 [Abeliophyllum distichum]|uniref:Uncharacterized protein n=1 Tax=Abeliophyllum distichum TaxID=126358 RepID=A0ABD1TZV1_9LAMI
MSRTLPNPSAQYGPSSDNFDLPPSCHQVVNKAQRIMECLKLSIAAVGAESLPRTPNDVPTRGACRQIKTSRIVRTTQEKIRVLYNSVSRRATSSIVHNLLVHDIGAIIRSHCPMNTCYWRTISSSEKKDLMDEITKSSFANIENRSKKKYNHRTGSRPLSYIVEEMAVDGSKFSEIDTFEFAYAGKNNHWTDGAAKAQHDEMLAKADEYLTERANEQQLPDDTPLDEILVDDLDARLKIMMSVLGVKSGRQIRRLGDGRLQDIGSSSNVCHMEKELEEERAA